MHFYIYTHTYTHTQACIYIKIYIHTHAHTPQRCSKPREGSRGSHTTRPPPAPKNKSPTGAAATEQDRAGGRDPFALRGGVWISVGIETRSERNRARALPVHTLLAGVCHFTTRSLSTLLCFGFVFFSEHRSLEQAVLELRMEQGRMLFLEERSCSTGEEQALGSRTIQKRPWIRTRGCGADWVTSVMCSF